MSIEHALMDTDHVLWPQNAFCGHRNTFYGQKTCILATEHVLRLCSIAEEHALWLGRRDYIASAARFGRELMERSPPGIGER